MAHNFRQHEWSGNLEELFDECFGQGPSSQKITEFSQFVIDGLNRDDELLPIRKFKNHSRRGKTFFIDSKTFMPVDNEPLIGLLNLALSENEMLDSFRELFTRHKLKGSWKFEEKRDEVSLHFKTGGVTSDFRSNGLKVAHIEDAAEGIGNEPENFTVRYLRSMMLANVFLFPSARCCHVEITTNENLFNGVNINDWAENELIRSLALGFVQRKVGDSTFEQLRLRLDPKLKQIPDWTNLIKNICVKVFPGRRRKQVSSSRTTLTPRVQSPANADGAMRKIPEAEARQIGFDRVIDELCQHRARFPNAGTLSEKPRSDPSKWVYLDIGKIFSDGTDDFTTTKTKETFKGSVYNGVHCFHGDADWNAIDDFIESLHWSENISDVLVPSATYEFDTLPKGKTQKPKLALNGFNGVDGFFLYKA